MSFRAWPVGTAVVVSMWAQAMWAQNAAAPVAHPSPPVPPPLRLAGESHSQVLQQLYDYHDSGRYDREIHQVAAAAHAWLETRTAAAKPGEQLAAVFDVDETSLSGYEMMADCGFCNSLTQARVYDTSKLSAIRPVQELVQFAQSRGVKVFFVTGRSEPGRDVTEANLRSAGYSGWTDLIMRPAKNTQTAAILKSDLRQSIENKGLKIILNIGDQLSDLTGCCQEKSFLLPNPFYFVQ